MTINDIISETGVHRATVYDWMARRGFPKPINAPFRPRRWSRVAVERWCRENGVVA